MRPLGRRPETNDRLSEGSKGHNMSAHLQQGVAACDASDRFWRIENEFWIARTKRRGHTNSHSQLAPLLPSNLRGAGKQPVQHLDLFGGGADASSIEPSAVMGYCANEYACWRWTAVGHPQRSDSSKRTPTTELPSPAGRYLAYDCLKTEPICVSRTEVSRQTAVLGCSERALASQTG
jgi:hypothetical protein